MTSPELEPGQSYDFTYRGKRLRCECLLTNGHKLLHRLYDEFDEHEVTDITRVQSESEWQRAQAIESAAREVKLLLEKMAAGICVRSLEHPEYTALRTALGE